MSIKQQAITNVSNGQSPGCDPKTSKRTSGIFSFFKWFKPSTSRESVTQESSPTSSCDSLNSIASAGTIASFSFVLPTEYQPDVIERNIFQGPETDTYKARLKQRENRRQHDKNVTLRKKYNLFFNRDTTKPSAKHDDNSKSLPLMTRKTEAECLYRRTNSESSKLKKAGAYCHVKGKRKAPQPPVVVQSSSTPSTMSLRNRKKRLAPQPPVALTPTKVKTSLLSIGKYETIEYADADVISNDSLKLDRGILKPVKGSGEAREKSQRSYEAPVSPRPWYKRNRETTPKKDAEDRYEPMYCKQVAKNDEKRKSGMSFLTNISELDREACDIVKNEQHEEAPAFMRLKLDNTKSNTDTWTSSPKRRSAKDLIAKFNAITNVTKVTVNSAFFGAAKESNAFQKDGFKRDYFGKPAVLNETPTKQNKTEVPQHSPLLTNSKNKIPLVKSESSAVVHKPCEKDTPPFDKKTWFCPKCALENDYWRIICYVCSTIKPYFDDLTAPPVKNNHTLEKNNKAHISEINHNPLSTSDSSKNTAFKPVSVVGNMHVLERSRTQIGFSALAKYNAGQKITEKPTTNKQEERERLKKMLIEMKNSLPKRRINSSTDAKRASVIQESVESDAKEQLEIITATRDTIYENIKIKETENGTQKPIKVSSSAQTSSSGGVINKVPRDVAEALKKRDSNYELIRPKDFDNIYSVKTEGREQHAYMNLDENDLYLKVSGNLAASHTDTLEVNRLLKRLEVAIAKGQLDEASNLARDLAQLKVNCSVVRQKVDGNVNGLEAKKTLVANMYVEDKVSHRGPFPINVTQDQTIAQLKTQIEEDFQIPTIVQRWIIGKELVTDDNLTLGDMKISTDGCPLFLYLVAPAKDSKAAKNLNAIQNNPVEKSDTEKGAVVKTSSVKSINKDLENYNRSSVLQDQTKKEKSTIHISLADTQTVVANNEKLTPVLVTSYAMAVHKPDNQSESRHQNQVKMLAQSSKVNKNGQTSVVSYEIKAEGATNSVVTITNVTPSFYLGKLDKEEIQASQAKVVALDELEDYDVKTLKPQKNQWECIMCTFINPPSSNICNICATVRKNNTKFAATQDQERHYQQLINLDNADLVENIELFECLICLSEIPPCSGVTLRECLHQFCKECLIHTIEFTEEAEVKCPYRDDDYSCDLPLQDREIKSLLTPDKYEVFLAKSVAEAENKIDKSFHCKTPDCKGWCIFEDNVNEFHCPVCRRTNCLTCQVIHMGVNCKQYQESIDESTTDENSKRTKEMLEEMVNKGEAIKCPTCQVILMKKWGCDWLRCSMCKTEICWVTRGPRWGPAGKGDTSGGCRCGVNAIKCHPKCNYCH